MADTAEERRQLYVAYRKIFVPDYADDDEDETTFAAEWARKTPEEQYEIVDLIKTLRNLNDNRKPLKEATDRHLVAMREIVRPRVHDMLRLRGEKRELKHQLQRVEEQVKDKIEIEEALGRTFEAMAAVEAKQVASAGHFNVVFAMDQAEAWRSETALNGQEIQGFQDFLDAEQPPPPNLDGKIRIPRAWAEFAEPHVAWEWQSRILVNRDRAERNLGLYEARGEVTWEPWQVLSGGLSFGCLWVCFDADGYVVDRVFRKDVIFADDMWHDFRYFDGDLRDADSKTCWEVSAHNAMQDVPGFYNVPRLREGKDRDLLDAQTHLQRMYVEWCPNGALGGLLERFSADRGVVPEPLVWAVAESLAECAKAMEDGHPDGGRRAEGWKSLVHRDIKPENIFLGHADRSRYPMYPRVMLGDFGLAFKAGLNDPTNPKFWAGVGTSGYFAPEQSVYVEQDTGRRVDETPLSAATNIWGIGAVLAKMMRTGGAPHWLPLNHEQPIWLGDGSAEVTLYTLQLPEDGESPYSLPLRRLVNDCLSFRMDDRPTAQQLVDRVKLNTQVVGRPGEPTSISLSRRMRSGNADPETMREFAVFLKPDDYQLQFARAQLPPRGLRSG